MEKVNESSSGTRDDLACDLYGSVFLNVFFLILIHTVRTEFFR